MSLTWRDALKKFNEERMLAGGGKYTIPKKGTPEYDKVKQLQNGGDTSEKPPEPTAGSKRSESKTPPKDRKSQTLIPEQAEVEMGEKKAKMNNIDIEVVKKKENLSGIDPAVGVCKKKEKRSKNELPPVETKIEPKPIAKVKVKKPDAPLPFQDGIIRFD